MGIQRRGYLEAPSVQCSGTHWLWEGEARLCSPRMGSSLPSMLQGKSSCFMLESCGGKPRGPCTDVDGDAASGAATLGSGCLQEHSYVVSVLWRAPTERGSFSPFPYRHGRSSG